MRAALVVSVLATLWAPGAHAAAPLVPRDLSELHRHPSTLVEVTPAGAAAVRAAGAAPVARTFGVWRLSSASAARLIPRLATSGALLEFAADAPLRAAAHVDVPEPLLPQQWWHARVGADRAEPPGPGVPVVVADSGVDVAHPEFTGRAATELASAQTVSGPSEFHGTAVASVVAAPQDGAGVLGVYPQAALVSWDVTPSGRVTRGEVIGALEHAALRGRAVVNLSVGEPARSRLMERAILKAYDRGVVVVAASGNDGERVNAISYPGALPHVLTVGATDRDDAGSSFSTRSAAVDLAAPGRGIPIAVPVEFEPSGYDVGDGTSFAAPIVAGALAWIWTARPGLDKTQVVELLRQTARDLESPGWDDRTGLGLLDIPAALAAPAPPPDPQEPNDDLSHVVAGSLFPRWKPLLTRPGRGRATLRARLHATEDPADVYRVWVPRGHAVTVSVRSRADLDLLVWDERTPSLTAASRAFLVGASARPGGNERVVIRNAGRSGRRVLVDVFPRSSSPLAAASYTLAITTARARR